MLFRRAATVPIRAALGFAVGAALLVAASTPATAGVDDCPIDPMTSPFSIRQIRDAGGRVFWSPDGEELAFMEDGEAFIRSMLTGEERCLTCAFESAGFERVQFLGDGSLLLIGAADEAEDVLDSTADFGGRLGGTELYWMSAEGAIAPQPLDQRVFEGVAMSPTDNGIAWTQSVIQQPTFDPSTEFELWTGTVEVGVDGAEIVDRVRVMTTFSIIEAQDILDEGATLLFTSYYDNSRRVAPLDNPDGEVMTVEVATAEVTNHSNNEAYDEAEGIFHGTDFDVFESGRDTGNGYGGVLDLYVMRLDGIGDEVRRLTQFAEERANEKANNPDVHPDGRSIAFSVARVTDDNGELTGQDAGILLLEFGCDRDAETASGDTGSEADREDEEADSSSLAATGGGATLLGLLLLAAAGRAKMVSNGGIS